MTENWNTMKSNLSYLIDLNKHKLLREHQNQFLIQQQCTNDQQLKMNNNIPLNY